MGLILLVASLAIVYSPIRNYEMLAIDDGMHTENNPKVWPLTWENLTSFWTEPYENAYTPVTYTTWMLLAQFARRTPAEQAASADFMHPLGLKYSAGVFHIGNLLFHIIAVVAVYALIFALFSSTQSAFFAASVFAFHPLQVESVCWITGLRDVLAGALGLFSILLYIGYIKRTPPEKTNFATLQSAYTQPHFVGSLVLFFIAVLAKSSSLVIPIFIGVIAFTHFRRPLIPTAVLLGPWFAFILPVVTVFTKLNASVAQKVVFNAPLEGRLIIALDSISFYIYKLFFPVSLTMDYGRTPQYVLKEFPYFWTAASTVLLVGTVSYFVSKNRGHFLLTALLIFIAGLIPVLGVNPFIFQHISTVADRYVYLSMFGFAFLIGHVFKNNKRPAFTFAAGMVLLFYIGKTSVQLLHWRNNLALFTHNLEINPRSWLAANDLGTVYENMKNYSKAADLYGRAAELSGIPSAWNNYGATALKMGDYSRAIDGFERALMTSNYSHWAYNNLATAHAHQGNFSEAVEQMSKAYEANPTSKIVARNFSIIKKRRNLEELKVLRSSQEEG